MSARRAIRQDEAAPDAAEKARIDPAIYDGANGTINRLAASADPFDRELAALAREREIYNRYIERLAGISNTQGHSLIDEHKTSQRNSLIRSLGKRMTAKQVRDGLLNYQTTSWPRDRDNPNPYPEYGPRFTYYKILQLRDYVPSERWIREILK